MPRHTNWRDLRVGLAAIVVVLLLVAGILFFGRLGRIPGETYHVYVRATEARGIIRGSDVWLAGQKVGAVRQIEFLPPQTGAANRVVLDVELSARHRAAIRRDAPVQIKSGGSLIGAPVVYLGIGTPGAAVVADGDTLQASPPLDLDGVTDRLATATEQVPELMENLDALVGLTASPDGSLGAFMHERGGRDLAASRVRMAGIASRARDGRGTIALALGGRNELMARARTVMSRADSVRQLVGSSETSLGRFRRDSTLAGEIADIRNEVTIVRALLAEPRGTAGRLVRDSAIVAGLATLDEEMALLLADVKRHPLRYLGF